MDELAQCITSPSAPGRLQFLFLIFQTPLEISAQPLSVPPTVNKQPI